MARRNGPSNYDGYGYGAGGSYDEGASDNRYGSSANRRSGREYNAYDQGGYQDYAGDPYAQQPYAAQDPYAEPPYGWTASGEQAGYSYEQYGYGQQSYNQQDGYGWQTYGQQNPYAQQPSAGQAGGQPYGYASQPSYGYGQQPCDQGGAYGQGQQSPYGQPASSARSGRSSRVRAGQDQQPTAYPVGSGRVYESSRTNRAAGVDPVSFQDRPIRTKQSSYSGGPGYAGNVVPPSTKGSGTMSRRRFLGIAGGAGLAALLGFVGVNWYTHRAVACTINGSPREAPVNSTVKDLVNRGYVYPANGNLVSICAEGETPTVLEQYGGNPYTLKVNGEDVDPETYRLGENDVLEFTNGTDRVEDVVQQNTEIECGIQFPSYGEYLAPVGYVAQWGRKGISTVETGVVSGRTIDRGVVQEPQDLIIAKAGVNPADGRLLVALTFDDGPELTYTPQYLDILARYGAKATFFNLGSNLEAGDSYAALAQRIVNEGHQLASHTYSHEYGGSNGKYGLSSMDVNTRNWEISHTFDLIEQTTGAPSCVMRPPYGEFRGSEYLQYLASGMTIAYSAYWTVDSNDWGTPGVDQIVYNCCGGLAGANYNGAIILMHDGGGDRSQNVQALPRIIETFQNAGYQLVTMNEMLSTDPTFPEWVWNPSLPRPEGAYVPDITGYV